MLSANFLIYPVLYSLQFNFYEIRDRNKLPYFMSSSPMYDNYYKLQKLKEKEKKDFYTAEKRLWMLCINFI